MITKSGADLGGGCGGCAPPPPNPEILRLSNATGCKKIYIYVVSSGHQSVTPFVSGAPPTKINPGSALGSLSKIFTNGSERISIYVKESL